MNNSSSVRHHLIEEKLGNRIRELSHKLEIDTFLPEAHKKRIEEELQDLLEKRDLFRKTINEPNSTKPKD